MGSSWKTISKYVPIVMIGFFIVVSCIFGLMFQSDMNETMVSIHNDGKILKSHNYRILEQNQNSQTSLQQNTILNEQSSKLLQNSIHSTIQQKTKNIQIKKQETEIIVNIVHDQQYQSTTPKKNQKQSHIEINKKENGILTLQKQQQSIQNHKKQQNYVKQQQLKNNLKQEIIGQPNGISAEEQQKTNTQQQDQQQQQLTDDGIQWPKKNQLYHIYSALNPRLVLDVAKAGDGFHDLILYQWQNSSNQMYYFKKAYGNFYHIINAESKQYMKKSQKIIASTGVSKVKFSNEKDDILWELVPAKDNAKNSFYILSSQKLALDLNEGYANNGAQIILYNWNKNDNQIWFLRKNQLQFNTQEFNQEKYQQKLSLLLYKVMSNPDSINECITFQEMKKQINSKNIPLPTWLARPQYIKPKINEMPPQTSSQQYEIIKKKSQLKSLNNYGTNSIAKNNIKSSQQQKKVDFKPTKLALQCAKNHTIAYIWYGQKQMPQDYKELMTKCKKNVRLLTEEDFIRYVKIWNKLQPIYAIDIDDYIIRQRINLLKLFYLFFESGIYADFDTQINEQCFSDVYADEIIWTSRLDQNIQDQIVFPLQQIVVPEESFMMIRTKEHPQVKRMLQQQIMEHNERGGQRWKQCKYRQCLIIQCQRHYRDNTYKKGFD